MTAAGLAYGLALIVAATFLAALAILAEPAVRQARARRRQ